jgi:hypothetical protein
VHNNVYHFSLTNIFCSDKYSCVKTYVGLHVGCQQLLSNLIQTCKTSTNADETPEINHKNPYSNSTCADECTDRRASNISKLYTVKPACNETARNQNGSVAGSFRLIHVLRVRILGLYMFSVMEKFPLSQVPFKTSFRY